MRKQTWLILAASHLIAVAVGGVIALEKRNETPSIERVRGATRLNDVSDRKPVRPSDLLKAYHNSEFRQEADALVGRLHPLRGADRAKRLQELADGVQDFQTYMDEATKRINAGEHFGNDALYQMDTTLRVMKRWLEADPEKALAWMGTVDMEMAWADLYRLPLQGPYARDPLGFYRLVCKDWKKRNRSLAVRCLGTYCATTAAEHAPAVIAKLEPAEVVTFFRYASYAVQPKDWQLWLDVLSKQNREQHRDTTLTNRFTGRLLQFNTEENRNISAQIMKAVEGTPIETLFQNSYAKALTKYNLDQQRSKVRKMTREDPAAAYLAWIRAEQESGMTAEQARASALQLPWLEHTITPHLQRVMLGQGTVSEALAEVREKFSDAAPELRAHTEKSWFRDALIVAPEETIRYALSNNNNGALAAGFDMLSNDSSRLGVEQRELLVHAMRSELWSMHSGVKTVLNKQLKHYQRLDPQAASKWAESLPTQEQRDYAGEVLRSNKNQTHR